LEIKNKLKNSVTVFVFDTLAFSFREFSLPNINRLYFLHLSNLSSDCSKCLKVFQNETFSRGFRKVT